ncbi:MAG: QacE family quaternary ammonium compound efflux transporter [Pseudomonadota bacterium]|jgi:quaternary ammonium compound-resistance protein SugE
MASFYLVLAGALEIVWAYYLKQSQGFTRPLPTIITLVSLVGSLLFLSLSLRALPLGTVYAIWTGIGAIGTFALGIALLGEPASAMRLAAAGLIVSGLVLMKLSV